VLLNVERDIEGILSLVRKIDVATPVKGVHSSRISACDNGDSEMTHKIRLFLCLSATLSTGVAVAVSPVAYVYVQQPLQGDISSAPIFAYAATSAGKLTPIKGSPFTATGTIVGTNGTHFITSYQTDLYSYDVASDGVIGAQASEINTGLYAGSDCGSISGAVLDHTGQDVYATLNLAGTCADVQTFEIGKTGTLTFLGATGDISHGGIAAETPLKS
jgi:hypothetical protein